MVRWDVVRASSVAPDRSLHGFVNERLFVERRRFAFAIVFPSRDVGEEIVVTLGLTRLGLAGLDFRVGVGELVLRAEVATTGLLAIAGVVAHQFAEFEEVSDTAG